MIEPIHIVVLGLLIALGGAIWQWRRPPSVDPQVASLQTEVANLTAGLAKALQPKSPTTRLGLVEAPQPSPEPTRYTAYEKEQRLRALDEIYNAIATQLQPTYAEGRKLLDGIYRSVDANAEEHLIEYRKRVQGAFDALNDLLKKYNYFTDIVRATTKNTFNDVAATHGVGNLVPEIQALRSKAPNDIQWFILRDITMMEARNQMRDFENYLNETLPRLQEMRAQIETARIIEQTTKSERPNERVIQAKLGILKELFDCLDMDATATYRFGLAFWSDWNGPANVGAPQGFLDFIRRFHDQVNATHEKLENIVVKNSRYPDVTGDHTFWYNPVIHEKDNLLRVELERILKQHPGDNRAALLLNNRFVEEWYAALNGYSNWIREKKNTSPTNKKNWRPCDEKDTT